MISMPLPTLKRSIGQLIKLGYLIKINNNLYTTTQNLSDKSIKSDTEGIKSDTEKYQIRYSKVSNLIPESIKSDTPNIYINKEDINNNINTHAISETKPKRDRGKLTLFKLDGYESPHVLLSAKEIKKLQEEIAQTVGIEEADKYLIYAVRKIDSHIEGLSNKKKSLYKEKNHFAVMNSWAIDAAKDAYLKDLKIENQKTWNYKNEKTLSNA
jgi:hypothetical protein